MERLGGTIQWDVWKITEGKLILRRSVSFFITIESFVAALPLDHIISFPKRVLESFVAVMSK